MFRNKCFDEFGDLRRLVVMQHMPRVINFKLLQLFETGFALFKIIVDQKRAEGGLLTYYPQYRRSGLSPNRHGLFRAV